MDDFNFLGSLTPADQDKLSHLLDDYVEWYDRYYKILLYYPPNHKLQELYQMVNELQERHLEELERIRSGK